MTELEKAQAFAEQARRGFRQAHARQIAEGNRHHDYNQAEHDAQATLARDYWNELVRWEEKIEELQALQETR